MSKLTQTGYFCDKVMIDVRQFPVYAIHKHSRLENCNNNNGNIITELGERYWQT